MNTPIELVALDMAGTTIDDGGAVYEALRGAVVDAVVTTSDVAAGRPAPYMIHRAMERTGVRDVRRVLAAGDTAVDVQAATNAGAVSVGVLTGKADPEVLAQAGADHVLGGVVDIPGLLATS